MSETNLVVPIYTLNIAGIEFSAELAYLVQNITYEERGSGASTLEVDFIDPDFQLMDAGIFEGAEVYFSLTIMGAFYTSVFNGFVSASDNDFPETGVPTIRLMCMDKSHVMNREKNSKTWKKMRYSEIAQDIASKYGLKADVDTSPGSVESSVSQAQLTDIAFLTSLAEKEKEPFTVYVRDDTLYYKKRDDMAAPEITLSYRINDKDIRSFSPRTNTEDVKETTKDANITNEGKHISGENGKTAEKNTQGNTDMGTPEEKPKYVMRGPNQFEWVLETPPRMYDTKE